MKAIAIAAALSFLIVGQANSRREQTEAKQKKKTTLQKERYTFELSDKEWS